MSDPFRRQVSLGYGTVTSLHNAADAGFARVGLLRLINRESRAKSSCLREAEADFARRDGGGGNRTRVLGVLRQRRQRARIPTSLTPAIPNQMSRTNLSRSRRNDGRPIRRGGIRRG